MDPDYLKVILYLIAYDRMTEKVNRMCNTAQARLSTFAEKANNLSKKAFDFGKQTAGIGVVTGALLAAPIKAAADMEKLNTALKTTFRGNEVASNAAFRSIRDFAGRTPYMIDEVMQGFIKLKNMGLIPSEDALESYGNTASAMGKGLNDMVEAVADAATGEFERLKEFGIRANSVGSKVIFTFQNQKTVVGKNSKEIEKYLINLGKTKFAGGIEAQSKTIYGQLSSLTDQFKMTSALAGSTLIPILNKIFQRINPIIEKVAKWIEKNPKLTETILICVAAFAALNLTLSAASFLFGGLTKAVSVGSRILGWFTQLGKIIMWVGRLFLYNPVLIVIGAIAVAAYLIIKNWEKIKAFFSNLWNNVKGIFSSAWNWLKNIFLKYTPAGLIVKHWDKIKAYFSNLWEKVKEPFVNFWNWITGLGSRLWEAGKNIISNIWEGIKSMINKPVELIQKMVGKIRKFLPFSPAKEGPLRDIHKIRLVETIAESVRPAPLVNAIHKVSKAARNKIAETTSPVATGNWGNSGSVAINATFNIHLNGSANKSDATLIANEIKKQFRTLMQQYNSQWSRVGFQT